MDNLKTDLERVRAAVGGPMPMKTMRAYLAASDDAFRFLRTHGEALAGMVKDAERYRFLADQHSCAWEDELDQAMQESRDE